jgi:chemotaxis protein methyltransferase CheR
MLDVTDIALTDLEFDRVRKRLYEQTGIALSDAKRTLVVARLSRMVRSRNLSSFGSLLDRLEQLSNPGDEQEFVNALTTNLTRFWREEHHFSHLVSYVGELMKARPEKRLRIWSAGCSTGQEPYTIALCLLAAYPELKRWDFKILATDIDTAVLAKAATAVYPAGEISALSGERRALFERTEDERVRVPAAAARLVSFKPLNLMTAWPMTGPFDAIFCRNVTIYFDRETQHDVFSRMSTILRPGAFLYIGHSEHADAGTTGLKLVDKTVYQMRGPSRATARKRDAA